MNFSGINSILNWHVRVGRLFGIPIHLHITLLFFLWPLLRGAGMDPWHTIEYSVGVVLSILLHELGHALTAKKFRMGGLSIMLHGFGGFATSTGYRSPKQALLITLAGPAVTFALGLILLAIGTVGLNMAEIGTEADTQFFLIRFLGSLNILLGFLNLIPSLPFDGGNAVRAILSNSRSDFKAVRDVSHFGLLFTPLLLIYWLVSGDSFVGVFGLIGLVTSYMTLSQTGGVRFKEMGQERRARKEAAERKKRDEEKHWNYQDQVYSRQRERDERERLRKLFEDNSD